MTKREDGKEAEGKEEKKHEKANGRSKQQIQEVTLCRKDI